MAKKKPAEKPIDSEQVKQLRKKSGLNQANFWRPLGVTQSGGSRYEAGRSIPKPVQALVPMVHGDEAVAIAQLQRIRSQVEQLRCAQ